MFTNNLTHYQHMATRYSSEETESSSYLESSSSSTPASSGNLLLSRLRSPMPSLLARKRRVRVNPTRVKRSNIDHSSEPKSTTPADRVNEYPDENFTVVSGNLFCRGCREQLKLKSSTIKNHIKSEKHCDGKKRLAINETVERDIASACERSTVRLEGDTLPVSQQVYRVRVVTSFLKAGVPLNKLDYFRGVLEEDGLRLTDRSHMSNLVPLILEKEKQLLKEEIAGKSVSIAFDGTSRLGEAMVIVARYVTEDWSIQHRILKVSLLAKSMSGEEVAREVINVLSASYGVASDRLLAAMKDRASVNGVAMRTINIVYPQCIDVPCLAHTLNIVGEHFNIPTAKSFVTSWISLFSNSPKARLLWKEQTDSSIVTYCATRWWSQWEVLHDVMLKFKDVEKFIETTDVSPATRAKLIAILSDNSKKVMLKLELAAVVDAGKSLVEATYQLEGDGPLIYDCGEIFDAALISLRLGYMPNVEAIARQLSAGNDEARKKLVDYARACIIPAIDYIDRVSETSFKHITKIFTAVKLFKPKNICEMKLS